MGQDGKIDKSDKVLKGGGVKIGVVREEKIPHDFRVPFTPSQLAFIQEKYGISCVIQPSAIRCYSDAAYAEAGIAVQEDLSDCTHIFGVKEVPIGALLAQKTYFFFSHTIKKQAYNQPLMRALLDKKIAMVDYEVYAGRGGNRFVAFGREAGIVGAYNALRAYGLRAKKFILLPPQELRDTGHLYEAVRGLNLDGVRICLTGAGGRVCGGAESVLEAAGVKAVPASSYIEKAKAVRVHMESAKTIQAPLDFRDVDKGIDDLSEKDSERSSNDSASNNASSPWAPIYTALSPKDYIKRSDGLAMDEPAFFASPEGHESAFLPYAGETDIYIACHYWDRRSSVFFTAEDIRSTETFPVQVISDISCDLEGPIPTTVRESTLENPIYTVARATCTEIPAQGDTVLDGEDTLTVTAVDNCPSAIPRDASTSFGEALLEHLVPYLLGEKEDTEQRLVRATICADGVLQEAYGYLEAYAQGKEVA